MDVLKSLRLLCKPALIYLIFATTQVVFDIYSKFFELALVKMIVSFLITFVLDTLCKSGMTSVAWIFIFIPFMLMTIVISILLLALSVNYKDVSSHKNQNTTPLDKLKDIYDEKRLEYAYVFDGNQDKKCKYSELDDVEKQTKEAKKHKPHHRTNNHSEHPHHHKHPKKHRKSNENIGHRKIMTADDSDVDYEHDGYDSDDLKHNKVLVD